LYLAVHPPALCTLKETTMSGSRSVLPSILAAVLVLGAADARAAVIQLLPSSQVAAPGDTVVLNLTVSGLGGSAVGDFDLDVAFDPALLTLTSVSLGPFLGDVGIGEAIDFSLGLLSPGEVNIAEVSLLSGAELDALQAEPFSLALLTFQVGALAPGAMTTVQLAQLNALGDAAGMALPVNLLGHASLTGADQVTIAEPHIGLLVGWGLYAGWRRRRAL
jgi:hypothetical protein